MIQMRSSLDGAQGEGLLVLAAAPGRWRSKLALSFSINNGTMDDLYLHWRWWDGRRGEAWKLGQIFRASWLGLDQTDQAVVPWPAPGPVELLGLHARFEYPTLRFGMGLRAWEVVCE